MTIIEFSVVLVIFMIVVSVSARAINQSQRDARFGLAAHHVQQMLDATQKFYELHCGKGDLAQPNVSVLLSEEILKSSELATNPFGSDFIPEIQWGSLSYGSRIIVSSTFDSSELAARYGPGLGADRVIGAVAYWDEGPKLHTRSQGLENAVNLHMYYPERCR